jgi:hypothetical protein
MLLSTKVLPLPEKERTRGLEAVEPSGWVRLPVNLSSPPKLLASVVVMEDVDVLEAQQRLIDTDARHVAEVSVKADFG